MSQALLSVRETRMRMLAASALTALTLAILSIVSFPVVDAHTTNAAGVLPRECSIYAYPLPSVDTARMPPVIFVAPSRDSEY